MKSESGIAEIQLLSLDAVDEYIIGSTLPVNATRVAGGIVENKELSSEPYDPPKDLYNNIIHQNGKRNFKLLVNTLQADLKVLDAVRYLHYQGGCDALVIREGYYEYEGNASGVPQTGGGTMWLKNPSEGIYLFQYPNRTHFGLGYEFKLEDKKQSIMLNLEAAVSTYAAKQLKLQAQTNIIKKSAVIIPDIASAYQNILELKELQRHDGTSWQTLMPYDDIDSLTLSLKSVDNKQTKDNRNRKHLLELDISVVGSDARCSTIHNLWGVDQFARIRLILTNPVTNLDYYLEVNKNTVTNVTNDNFNKDRAEATFRVNGQFSSSKVMWDVWTTRTIKIG